MIMIDDEFINVMEGKPIYDHDDGERMAARIKDLEAQLKVNASKSPVNAAGQWCEPASTAISQ